MCLLQSEYLALATGPVKCDLRAFTSLSLPARGRTPTWRVMKSNLELHVTSQVPVVLLSLTSRAAPYEHACDLIAYSKACWRSWTVLDQRYDWRL